MRRWQDLGYVDETVPANVVYLAPGHGVCWCRGNGSHILGSPACGYRLVDTNPYLRDLP